MSAEELADGEAYHRALYAEGDIMSPLGWHRDSSSLLIEMAMPLLHEGARVVDYGCGTGGSAIELLKACDARGLGIELMLVDPLPSWFHKAHSLLADRPDVRLELSLRTDADGRRLFRTLDEMLDGEHVDLIVCSSTFHLIPAKVLDALLKEMAGVLLPGGSLVWSSGDIAHPSRPSSRALLHDPYRMVRARLRGEEARLAALDLLDEQARTRCERAADAIFPEPPDVSIMLNAVEGAGMSSRIATEQIEMSLDDAERFILVPRLSDVAAPLDSGEQRDQLIRSALEASFTAMREGGKADDDVYRIHWTFGVHELA